MADYYTQFCFEIPAPEYDKKTLLDLLWKIENNETEEDLLDHPNYLELQFDAVDEVIKIYTEDFGNVDNAARVTQYILKTLNLPPMGFEWANSCSKPRLYAFGGGACWITQNSIEYLSTNLWLDKKNNAQMHLSNRG